MQSTKLRARLLMALFLCTGAATAFGIPLAPEEGAGQHYLSCEQRLEIKRQAFEKDCSSSGPRLSCSERCAKEPTHNTTNCLEKICADCEDLAASVANLEKQCGSSGSKH